MKLTEVQLRHLLAIEWLIADGFTDVTGNNRAIGRTQLLAYAYLLKAIRYPNTYVRVRDHTPHPKADEILLFSYIRRLTESDDEFNKLKFRFRAMDNSLMCEK